MCEPEVHMILTRGSRTESIINVIISGKLPFAAAKFPVEFVGAVPL